MRDRSCFGYMEPSPNIPDFAQCGACQLFIKNKIGCYWLPDTHSVDADDSCIMYVQGDPITDQPVNPTGSLTPAEVGFTNGKVRCENCNAFDKAKGACALFRELTELWPRVFKLDSSVKPRACCNAFERGAYSEARFVLSRIMRAMTNRTA